MGFCYNLFGCFEGVLGLGVVFFFIWDLLLLLLFFIWWLLFFHYIPYSGIHLASFFILHILRCFHHQASLSTLDRMLCRKVVLEVLSPTELYTSRALRRSYPWKFAQHFMCCICLHRLAKVLYTLEVLPDPEDAQTLHYMGSPRKDVHFHWAQPQR